MLTLRRPVSLVDGYNLPLRVSNNKGCHVADCPVDLGPNCEWSVTISGARACADIYHRNAGPDQLKGPFDSTGFPVGCKSACVAGLGDPGMSRVLIAVLGRQYAERVRDLSYQ